MLKSMSCPNIAAPGEALSTVLWIERMAHAASDRKTLMSLGFTELPISISAVHNMFITTACICSSMAFACGFLTLVGLRFMPYVLHRAGKRSLNSLPFLHISINNVDIYLTRSCTLGYWFVQMTYQMLFLTP
jgi:hypothetical protein